jgi:hypothetical protein
VRAIAVPVVLVSLLCPQALRAEDDEDELRERLTERVDKRRPREPWSIEVGGRALSVSGEYEVELGYLRPRVYGAPAAERDRLLLEQGLVLEGFWGLGPALSLFAQVRVAMEEDLLPDTQDDVSDFYVEREEMWLVSEDVGASPVSVEFGRLNFEDDRRFWWDDELDAVRVEYEASGLDVALALARELAPTRSDHDYVEPDDDRVLRLLAEASWDFAPGHALELFLLHQRDRSQTDSPGEVVPSEREDPSDATLAWLGLRSTGVFELPRRGFLGYWLDTAWVHGDERQVEFEELPGHRSEASDVVRRDVSGYAVDTGVGYTLPVALEPRLFAGYAFTSRDSTPDTGSDRSFRQSGLQANEAGFGGVERFPQYGILLAPELSNLRVWTLGAGVSLFESSSLDLVWHGYRQVEAATSLRESRLDATLTGRSRDLGQELDLVLAVEEWERFEFDVAASVLHTGSAFGADRGEWSAGGFLAVRFAF